MIFEFEILFGCEVRCFSPFPQRAYSDSVPQQPQFFFHCADFAQQVVDYVYSFNIYFEFVVEARKHFEVAEPFRWEVAFVFPLNGFNQAFAFEQVDKIKFGAGRIYKIGY